MPQFGLGIFANDGTGAPGPRAWLDELNRSKLETYNLRYYGAKGDGVTFDDAAITAWLAAVPIGSGGGGLLYAPRGNYRHAGNIFVDNKRVWLIGDGPSSELNTNLSATVFTKAASLQGAGVTLSGHAMGIQGITFRGEAGNGGDGISLESNYQQLRDVSVFGMGNDGIRVGANVFNVNCFKIQNVISRNNARHGFNCDDGVGGVNANVGTVLGLECSLNGGDGIFLDNCFGHSLYNVLTSSNTGSGVHIGAAGSLHAFFGGDFNEGNGAAQDILCDAGSLQNHFYGGQVTRARITDNGTENVFLTTRLLKMPYLKLGWNAVSEAVLVSGVDVGNATVFQPTLTAARVVGAPLNPLAGQRITFTFVQDGTGGRAITWNAVFKVSWSDTGNTLGKRSSISFIYDGANWNQDGAQTPYV